MKVRKNNQYLNVVHNSNFKTEDTQLFLVGSGLGDLSVIHQVGITFFEMCDEGRDPNLGKVVISFGSSIPAFYPMKGDFNVWWCWGNSRNWISEYFEKVKVQPDVVLCPSYDCLDAVARDHNVATLYSPSAANRVFKPLHYKRSGICYSGLEDKAVGRMKDVVFPVMGRSDFEWRKKDWLPLDDFNKWYNSKLIALGTVSDLNRFYAILTNRVYEVFASGTPLIYPVHRGFTEVFNLDYRYQTDSSETTLKLIDEITADPKKALKYMEKLSKVTRTEHTYEKRLENLFYLLERL